MTASGSAISASPASTVSSANEPTLIDRENDLEVTVVVPVHNEEGNVDPLLEKIVEALDLFEFEIVCVDDGSTDATPQRLAAAMSVYPQLRVLRQTRNCGQSTALHTGVRAARASRIATLDGDGQNDPADIPRLLEILESSGGTQRPQLVVGHRRCRRDSLVARLSSRIANAVRSRLLHDATPDTGCGLKVFSRDAFMALPYFDHMHRFLPALFVRAGGKVLTVDVNHYARLSGRSHYGINNRLWTGIIDLFGVMWLARRMRHAAAIELAASPQESTV